MKMVSKIQAVALCGIAGLFAYATDASTEEIRVDAGPGIKWVATCDRCTQVDDKHVKVSVKPGDVIVFRQNDRGSQHGLVGAAAELEKIAKRGEADSADKIAVELAVPRMFGLEDFQKIGFPVEVTRIMIKDNFSGSLSLVCNVHGSNMKVTLEKN